MCILPSVGKKAINHRDDAKTVQILLNLNLGSLVPYAPLSPDGSIGTRTINLIEEFQRTRPGQLGVGLIISRRRIVVESMIRALINMSGVRHFVRF